VITALIMAWPIMWLWNWTLPAIFGFVQITYSQAFGLYLLAGCLVKGVTVNTSD
jgi:hypothetical protein